MLVPKEQLYWRTRRGMLELDIMLQTFLDDGYDSLDTVYQEAFIEMLEFADQDLLELFMAREIADSPHISHVIQKIRNTTLANA